MFYWLVVKPDSLPLLQREAAEQTVSIAPYPHAFPPVGADVDYFLLHLINTSYRSTAASVRCTASSALRTTTNHSRYRLSSYQSSC